MSFVDSVCERIAPHLAAQDKDILPVCVLSAEHRVVLTGHALFKPAALRGVFWPSSQWPAGTDPASVASLRQSDGAEFQVSDFHRCPSEIRDHYHFTYEAARLWKLTPIQPDSPHMKASWHSGYSVVRAATAEAARELAHAQLTIAVEARSAEETLFSPWKQHDLVTCEPYEGMDFERTGTPGVLHPAV